jgi:hypothetical protein
MWVIVTNTEQANYAHLNKYVTAVPFADILNQFEVLRSLLKNFTDEVLFTFQ